MPSNYSFRFCFAAIEAVKLNRKTAAKLIPPNYIHLNYASVWPKNIPIF